MPFLLRLVLSSRLLFLVALVSLEALLGSGGFSAGFAAGLAFSAGFSAGFCAGLSFGFVAGFGFSGFSVGFSAGFVAPNPVAIGTGSSGGLATYCAPELVLELEPPT